MAVWRAVERSAVRRAMRVCCSFKAAESLVDEEGEDGVGGDASRLALRSLKRLSAAVAAASAAATRDSRSVAWDVLV